jgi:hypothetical protein
VAGFFYPSLDPIHPSHVEQSMENFLQTIWNGSNSLPDDITGTIDAMEKAQEVSSIPEEVRISHIYADIVRDN